MDELIEYETKVASNFLSKSRYKYALPTSLSFLLLCLVLSNIYWQNDFELSHYLSAKPSLIFKKSEYWRLFTSSLIHGDFSHFLSNSLMLSFMGYFVAAHYGWIIFPFISLLAGGLINYIVLLNFNHDITIVGASGILYFLWGFWLILYLFIQRHISLNRRFMKIAAISLVVLIPTSFSPNVSYLAHLVGFLLGIFLGFIYFVFRKDYIFSLEVKKEIANIIPDIDYTLKI